MGSNPKRKSPSKPASGKEGQEWRKIFFGAMITLLVALIPYLWGVLKPTPPEFALINQVQRPDSAITIEAQNRAAAKEKNLTVQFDRLKIPNAGILQPGSEPRQWRFHLQGRGLPDSLVRDGWHRLRVGFAGEELSEPLEVLFSTQAPLVSVEVTHPPGKPNERIFIGRAVSRLPSPADTLTVDIAFNSGGSKPVEIPVPVKRVIEESTGRMYFEFETTVQGLPKISPKDPRYAEPFFALRITDAAGNRQYQEESYAQFTAPGDKRFGATKADIEFKRLPVEVPLKGFGKLDQNGNLKLTFRITPRTAALTQLANGQPAIILRVTSIAGNMRQLDWTNLPDSLRMAQPVTTILRNEQPLGQSLSNQFTDTKAPSNREATYRVEQTGRDGKVYGSNDTKASKLMGFLNERVVRTMLEESNLFDNIWNPSGPGIAHKYSEIEHNGVIKLVIDNTTGLMWQKDGSNESMTFSAAHSYITALNVSNYGGYNDWRMPTLREAMTLMEREKNGGLYLDTVFGRMERYIWTSNLESVGRAWVAYFSNGSCYYNDFGRTFYVRAVRDGQ